MNQYGLAIHTASAALGLAIADVTGQGRSQVWDLGRETSNLLHHYLVEFLASQTWADLAFLAVAQGPGGFTGTRLGVVTARTLAQQLDLSVFAVSTLAASAWQAAKTLPDPTTAIALQMRAQREEVFGAIYQFTVTPAGQPHLHTLFPDTVMSAEQWEAHLAQQTIPYHFVAADADLASATPDLLELAIAAWHHGDRPHWSTALPFYGQHPVT